MMAQFFFALSARFCTCWYYPPCFILFKDKNFK